ncbi:MAG: GTP 3',8-cyclase MoaA, partial [Campylobacter sp.]|nr:GTP 3',8-cyclase MoaA [Campylobacter sp.]
DGLLIPCLYFDEGKSILAAMKQGDLASAKQILADVLANKPEKNRWQENQISERGFYQTGG